MTTLIKISTSLAVSGALLGAAVAVFAAVPMAGTNVKEQKAKCQNCPAPVNNVNFGYYETRWREWPCQPRPDKTFPGSIGREGLQTPSGEPTQPLPRAEKRPPSETLPPRTTPGEGGILPPGGPGGIPSGPFAPPLELPAEPSAPAPPGMPGLPPLDRPGTSPLDRPILPPTERPALPPGGERPETPAGPPTLPSGPLTPRLPIDPQGRIAPPTTLEPGPTPVAPFDVPTSPSASAAPLSPAELPTPIINAPAAANQPASLPTSDLAGTEKPAGMPAAMQAAALPTQQPAEALAPPTGSVWRLQRAVEATRAAEPREPAGGQRGWAEAALESAATSEQAYAPPATVAPEVSAATATPEPVRPVDHQATVEAQFRGATRPVYEQAEPQPAAVQGAWQAEAAPALEGYCPVSLVKHEQWVKGAAKWMVVHDGKTYYLAGEVERECFLIDAERYVAAGGGCDIVVLADTGRTVAGVLDYCVTYDGRLYMFSSAGSLAKFRQNAPRYLMVGK